MRFKDVIGNDDLKQQLVRMVDEGRVSHAIMFVEKGGYGAMPLALATAQYMSCRNRKDGDSCGVCPSCVKISKLIHPDLHFAFPVNVTAKLTGGVKKTKSEFEKLAGDSSSDSSGSKKPISDNFLPIWRSLVTKNPYFTEDILNRELEIEDKVGAISVTEAREILSQMSLRSYEGDNKYTVIWLPERMTTEAANRLLKLIEEPFPGTFFFLISQSPEKVIDTIRSRCMRIQLYPMEIARLASVLQSQFSLSAADAYAYASSCTGNYGVACNAISEAGNVSPYLTILQALLEGCISKDLLSVLGLNDQLVDLGREKQKEFCLYSEDFLRKVLMLSKGLDSIANLTSTEAPLATSLAKRLPEGFYEKAFGCLEGARTAVENNVNAKMVFCNLGNLFFVAL